MGGDIHQLIATELRHGRPKVIAELLRRPDLPKTPLLQQLAAESAYSLGRSSRSETIKLAKRLLISGPSGNETRALLLLADLEADACEYGTAQTYLRRAAQVAADGGDVASQADAHLRLLPIILNENGPTVATGIARQTARLVARTGDSQAFALLHIRLAEIDARRGSLDAALTHLNVALDLLNRDHNHLIAATHWLDRTAVQLYLGKFEEALEAAHRTMKESEESGCQKHRIAALGNRAFAALQLGEIDVAESAFEDIPNSISVFPNYHLAVLDNKSELRVLQGRLEEADALLQQATQLAESSPGLRNSWQHLAATESRVRLLQLRGNLTRAGQLALDAEQDATRRADDLLRTSYRLLRASIYIETGTLDAAATVLSDVLLRRASLSRSQELELDRLLAEYFARVGEPALAHDHVLRAARLQGSFSNAISRVSLSRTAAFVGLPALDTTPGAQHVLQEPPRPPALDAISLKAVEQLFPLALNPELLGREVLSLLFRSGCVTHAQLRRTKNGDDPLDLTSIALGTFLEHTYRIDATPCAQLVALETFATIRALVALAVKDGQHQHKEALQTALWRFEPQAPDGGPLVWSASMKQILATIHQLAVSDVPVLLTGETGTGKEVFARELHRLSRAKGPFVPFNCTAVAADMLDAQLFGHRRGAFTGAIENIPGIVRSASGGTLFLDEIGELDVDLQPKLLRLLDRSEVQPLGEAQPVAVRLRLVAATNANLDALIAARRFREDLYYRLNVARVHVPPLRERREEIPPLAEHFLDRYARDANRLRPTLNDEAVEALLLCRWPGNVRQLASEMRRLVALCRPGAVVNVSDLSPDVQPRAAESNHAAPVRDTLTVALNQPLDAALEQVERALIAQALAAEGGHVERAARRLGLSRKGLFLKRRRLGLDP